MSTEYSEKEIHEESVIRSRKLTIAMTVCLTINLLISIILLIVGNKCNY